MLSSDKITKLTTEQIENLGGCCNETEVPVEVADLELADIDEKATLRKIDIRVLPILTLLYLMSFLDRGNIGNAKIEGMGKSLHLQGSQFNLCLTVFYLFYSAFDVPANVALKLTTPSIWLPSIMIAWGIATTCMGTVNNFNGLLICRVFLGITEAGFFPGVAYYLTTWYCNTELGSRQALFFAAASLAGAFSGLLAFAIENMDGVGGYAGWRWIFILEGLATIVVAIGSYFMIPDGPQTANFLTESERQWVLYRLKYQGSRKSTKSVAETDEFQWKYVWRALKSWNIYLAVLVHWGMVTVLYGISMFLPTIIKQLGYTATKAQLLTIPIYGAACICTVIISFLSDHSGQRSPWLFGLYTCELIGFIMAIVGSAYSTPGVVYAGVFLATCASYSSNVLSVTWILSNLAPAPKRAVGIAVLIMFGNLGGAFASNFYRAQDAPKYLLGHGLEIMFITIGMVSIVCLRLAYAHINAKRDLREAEAIQELSEEQLADMGDRAPTFRYNL